MNSANIRDFMQESAASDYNVIEKAKLWNMGWREKSFPFHQSRRTKCKFNQIWIKHVAFYAWGMMGI